MGRAPCLQRAAACSALAGPSCFSPGHPLSFGVFCCRGACKIGPALARFDCSHSSKSGLLRTTWEHLLAAKLCTMVLCTLARRLAWPGYGLSTVLGSWWQSSGAPGVLEHDSRAQSAKQGTGWLAETFGSCHLCTPTCSGDACPLTWSHQGI